MNIGKKLFKLIFFQNTKKLTWIKYIYKLEIVDIITRRLCVRKIYDPFNIRNNWFRSKLFQK